MNKFRLVSSRQALKPWCDICFILIRSSQLWNDISSFLSLLSLQILAWPQCVRWTNVLLESLFDRKLPSPWLLLLSFSFFLSTRLCVNLWNSSLFDDPTLRAFQYWLKAAKSRLASAFLTPTLLTKFRALHLCRSHRTFKWEALASDVALFDRRAC